VRHHLGARNGGLCRSGREDFRKYIARSDLPAMIIHDDDDDHILPANPE
jgi:hypothetical protein